MPDSPRTPVTAIRIHEPLKTPAAAKATAEGRYLSEVVRTLLAKWVGLPPEAARLDWQPDQPTPTPEGT